MSCDSVCILTTNDRFCKLTPLDNVDLRELSDCVEYANECIEEFIDDCFEICDTDSAKVEDLKNNKHFQRLYNQLIYGCWLCTRGDGQATKKGISKAQSDEYSEFAVLDTKNVQKRIIKHGERVKKLTIKFQKWFFKKFPDCEECKEETTTCDCEKPQCNECSTTCHQEQICKPISNWSAV